MDSLQNNNLIEYPKTMVIHTSPSVANGVIVKFDMPNRIMAHEFRNLLAAAMNSIHGNEKLFNYEHGETKSNISPFRFGPGSITALDQDSATWLVSRSYEITGVLSKHFGQFVDFKMATIRTSIEPSFSYHGYVAKALTFAKSPEAFRNFQSKTDEEKKQFLADKIRAGLLSQMNSLDMVLDGNLSIIVNSFSETLPVLLKPDQNGRPLWATALKSVNFIANVKLNGSWSAGYLNARGNGNIVAATIPTNTSINASDLLLLLNSESGAE